MEVEKLLVSKDKKLKDALSQIGVNAEGAVFVVDEQKRLVGILTDGDIRRYLLSGGKLSDPLKLAMNEKPFSLNSNSTKADLINSISPQMRIIPLVDNNGVVVDWATMFKIRRLPIAEPNLEGNELNYLVECLKTNWISSQGKFVNIFENMFAEYVGRKPYGLAVSNGTSALHLALVSLGIGEGDEVIVPDFTFAASVNAIIYTGATPVLVDVDEETRTIDIDQAKKAVTQKTKAIMPVHLFGHPCDMDRISRLAGEHNLLIIEDAAQALGSEYKGKKVGGFSDAACFSFFGNKIITTGEGGMILFRDGDVYEKARMLRDHGISPEKRYWHNEIGYNYRLTNMQAAVGVAQMERIDTFVIRKLEIAANFEKLFKEVKQLTLPVTAKWAKNTFWLYTVMLDIDNLQYTKDEFLEKLTNKGVETRPVFYPMHQMPPYKKYVKDEINFPVSTRLSEHGFSLPSAVTLKDQEIEEVARIIKRLLRSSS